MNRIPIVEWIHLWAGWSPIAVLLILFSGCGSSEQIQIRESTDAGFYQNHVRSDLVRTQITESFRSVRRIQSTVTYRTYQFYADDMPLKSQVQGANLEAISVRSTVDNHSSAGTGIILSPGTGGRVSLLTAAHTVTHPDTIWHYGEEFASGNNHPVEAVSVLENVNQFIFTDDGIELLELVLWDEQRDLAIMRSLSGIGRDANLRPLSLAAGSVENLSWTDMIYAVGYPRGVQMVTQGTVSRMNHPYRNIVMDISINRGFSGGAVFAVRSDNSSLEWVGIITSAMGERESYLIPERRYGEDDYDPDIPYEGEVYVNTSTRIHYGITNAIGVDQIRDFLDENSTVLLMNGIQIPSF